MTNTTKNNKSHREMHSACKIRYYADQCSGNETPQWIIDWANNVPVLLDPSKPHIEIFVRGSDLILQYSSKESGLIERRIPYPNVEQMKKSMAKEAENMQDYILSIRAASQTRFLNY